MSGDVDRQYLADGIADDLITRLSQWRDFPVIARNSSFTYRGRPVRIEQIGRELRARYVVEGSLRLAGERVRINVQLIDATEQDHHIWAQHFDGELGDIFGMQQRITESIVGAMHPELLHSESERAMLREPTQPDAWDKALRGLWHFRLHSREGNVEARRLFDESNGLDPGFVLPIYYRSWMRYKEFFDGWVESTLEEVREEIRRDADRCIQLDRRNALGHMLAALSSMLVPDGDKAISSLRRALEWDPSLPRAHSFLGQFLALGGDPEGGVAEVEEAIRLSPKDPELHTFYSSLALANFIAANYEASIHWAEMSLRVKPDFWANYTAIASSHANLDRQEEAEEAARELLARKPDFSIDQSNWVLIGARSDDYARFKDGLLRAGLKAGSR
jgi:TolB-like protein